MAAFKRQWWQKILEQDIKQYTVHKKPIHRKEILKLNQISSIEKSSFIYIRQNCSRKMIQILCLTTKIFRLGNILHGRWFTVSLKYLVTDRVSRPKLHLMVQCNSPFDVMAFSRKLASLPWEKAWANCERNPVKCLIHGRILKWI
jgi:hypothetical protein